MNQAQKSNAVNFTLASLTTRSDALNLLRRGRVYRSIQTILQYGNMLENPLIDKDNLLMIGSGLRFSQQTKKRLKLYKARSPTHCGEQSRSVPLSLWDDFFFLVHASTHDSSPHNPKQHMEVEYSIAGPPLIQMGHDR